MSQPSQERAERVGCEEIDSEHEVQVGMLDTLHVAIENGQDHAVATRALEDLLNYTRAHFLSEKLLMRLHAYPEYEAHVQEHDLLLDTFDEIRREFETRRGPDVLKVVASLRDSLLGHIRRQDRELGTFLSRSQVGQAQG